MSSLRAVCGYLAVEKLPRSVQTLPLATQPPAPSAGAGVCGAPSVAGRCSRLSASAPAPRHLIRARFVPAELSTAAARPAELGMLRGAGTHRWGRVSGARGPRALISRGSSAILRYPGHVLTHFLLVFPSPVGSAFPGGRLLTRLVGCQGAQSIRQRAGMGEKQPSAADGKRGGGDAALSIPVGKDPAQRRLGRGQGFLRGAGRAAWAGSAAAWQEQMWGHVGVTVPSAAPVTRSVPGG